MTPLAKLGTVKVLFQLAAKSRTYKNVENTYEKGSFFCILFYDFDGEKKVHKYPIQTIFRVEEETV